MFCELVRVARALGMLRCHNWKDTTGWHRGLKLAMIELTHYPHVAHKVLVVIFFCAHLWTVCGALRSHPCAPGAQTRLLNYLGACTMRNALCAGGVFLLATVFFAPDVQAQISDSSEGECNKGIFWPFVRRAGNCPTDAEISSRRTGNYRGSEVPESDSGAEATAPAQAQQSAPLSEGALPPVTPFGPNSSPTVASPTAASPLPAIPATGAAAVQPASAQDARAVDESAAEDDSASDDRATYTGPTGCTKGIFWPFVRRPGSCPTDAEISSRRTGTYQ